MKKITVFILALTVFVFFGLFVTAQSLSEEREIYDMFLRLHIPASSDSEEDQAVKLKVRDAVIELISEPLKDCKSKDESVKIVQSMTNEITFTANKVLKENNMDYQARVSVVKEHYPEREYDGITLPAGEYTSLKIELGEAEGKNWWCVLFPQVCVGCARPTEALAEVGFTANQIKLLTESEDYEYVVKFKLLEIVEEIFG